MEKHEEQKFVAWCKERNYLCLKLQLANQRGFMDRTVVTPEAGICFLEFKTPVGRLSPHQKHWIAKLRALGHKVFVPRSCEEAIGFVTGKLTAQTLS